MPRQRILSSSVACFTPDRAAESSTPDRMIPAFLYDNGPSLSDAAPLILEGNAARNRQFNLSAGRNSAENVEAGSNPIRPLAHSRKPPVPASALDQDVRFNAAAVVGHPE
jgi:hypothetical protein